MNPPVAGGGGLVLVDVPAPSDVAPVGAFAGAGEGVKDIPDVAPMGAFVGEGVNLGVGGVSPKPSCGPE